MGYEQRQAPPRQDQSRQGSGLGALWILLAPLACCGGPLIIGALAAVGALAWGELGLGLALATAVAVILVTRRRREATPAALLPGPTPHSPLKGPRRDERP